MKCCYGCVAPKKHEKCHGDCPEYLAEKAEYDRLKDIEKRKRIIAYGIWQQREAFYRRVSKKQRNLRK